MKDIFSKRQRFSLRKLTIGVCSVLLGTTIFATNAVAAEEVSATAAEATTTAVAPATTVQATTETETTAAPAATEAPTVAEETTIAATASGETPRTRSRRAASQGSDTSPVEVETTLKDGETADPVMSNPNGARVQSRDITDSSYKKADTDYTFHVLDLTRYNERYNTNYYTRSYKPFSDSNNVTVELVDKNTGSVIETVQINETSGPQTFQKTKQASNGELTLYVKYDKNPGNKGRDGSPFLQFHWEVDKVIQTYAELKEKTPENEAKQKLYEDVFNSRTMTDKFNAVEPAYDGRTITDTNALIPQVVNNTTLYKIVDKSNPTYQAGRTETSTQSYKESGKEEKLASYKMKAMEGQNFNASGVRQFDGYRLYQAADPTTTSGYVSSPYKVGTKFMDADRYGIKRIKEVVDEDGSVVIRVYLLDPKQQSKRSDGTLSTDGYMLIAETQPIKPGNANTEELAKVKSTLNTIAFTGTDGVNHPNGIEVGFDFQKAAGYTPYKTVFVPFLGDRIGHGSPNSQLERGVGGIGTNVDLLNSLTPFKQPVYYYEKVEPVKVKPEFKKTLEGRNLVDGEFSFTIKEQNSSADGHEETVQNADGKVSFSELTFNKVGTYKYKITEKAGSEADVDYDAMEITMTVEVTQDAAGILKTKVTYSAEGGETSKADDQEFNNFVVSPVTTKFDFTKKLEGRPLKDKEFSFVLKDADGNEIETVKNDADGNVTFSALSYDKTKVGTHKYTVEEVIPATKEDRMDYDTMKANITVKVSKSGHVLTTVTTFASEGGNATGADDKEFNNKVTPPPTTPEFKPEKFVVNKEKFDITGDKLMNDDDELTDEVADTNANPYADKSTNNEPENINGKTLKKGDKFYYQVWLDTTKFTADQNIQYVGITDDYEEDKLDVTKDGIKVYDSVTGEEVTSKFDIKVEDGKISATSKAEFVNEDSVIDTTKFAFGRYYKFDIAATIKTTVKDGIDIENTASQIVHVYDPYNKTVEKPEKPTQKRVVNIPVSVDFNFTKKLEGRTLKAEEFSFVLKDAKGTEIETVKNDKDGNVKFKALEFTKDQVGTHKYTIEEVAGSDSTVTYDKMKAEVTVEVKYDGTAKALIKNVTDAPDKEFNNTVTPPTTPEFQPEKFILNKEKFDLTGDKLMDDDNELTDEYAETNADPYVDGTDNNEAENINTKTVKRGDKVVYQVWLDTTKFTAAQNIQSVGITDNYDEAKLTVEKANIKAYDSKTGEDVTAKFDITVENGVITATSKASLQKSLGDAEDTQVLDTTKFAFGRYYKFDIVATVKEDVKAGSDIENTAVQVVNQYDPTSKTVKTPEKSTQKRVINVPIEVEFNFTKKLEGRELKENEFSFVLKDAKGTEIETVKNDKDGNVKFKAIEYNKDQAGTYKYTIEEVAGTDATVTYDKMKAEVTVEVKYDGTAKALITKVTDAEDKEFNNTVTPPGTPEFKPKKFVLNEEKVDITGEKLVDDDSELTDSVADTNANPYADKYGNNEPENINTMFVRKGDKIVYQVWLDTKQFTQAQNIQSVGITDDYDEAKLDIDIANIKAYDSVTGEDVTDKFDIAIANGVITATSKKDLTKSLGDAENTQVIDTTKLAFSRYYKFDIVATVKQDVPAGSDIENTAMQVVHQYDPTSKTVVTPKKPTEKRVVNVPITVDFNFTKKLEGRELQAGEFSFQLKDDKGNVIETVKNDAEGKVKFRAIEFFKGDEGVHKFTVEEVAGKDGSVTYDTMKAEITVNVAYDGTAKVLTTTVTDAPDKEFNNTVTPPETPEFQPKKFVVKDEKFDTTGDKLVDDDAELTNAVTDTKADPYADKTDNNEAENINTSTLKKGDKVVYQVWLDTTKFDANNKDYIQSVGITDNYDKENLTVDVANIKAYDSVTGEDVTAKFDIKVENGVITATSKADLTKSLGDAENTQVLDTTKFAFGRYYKFDIVATIKETAKDGVDIENTASQTVHQYDPTKKTTEKPEKPTETRVVNIPTKVEFEFTKKLEGRPLKEGEFSFVLKDKDGNVIETVTNDADGKIKFSALTFKRGEEGVYTYTVEEVKGTEEGVTYDPMVATVTVTVSKDGKVLTAVAGLPEDTEFNNTVTPPNTPNTPPQTPLTPGKPQLPNTGVEDLSVVFNAASMSLLAGLGLLVTGKKKEDEE